MIWFCDNLCKVLFNKKTFNLFCVRTLLISMHIEISNKNVGIVFNIKHRQHFRWVKLIIRWFIIWAWWWRRSTISIIFLSAINFPYKWLMLFCIHIYSPIGSLFRPIHPTLKKKKSHTHWRTLTHKHTHTRACAHRCIYNHTQANKRIHTDTNRITQLDTHSSITVTS